MKKDVKLSIIMPSYNKVDFISNAIDSVLSQETEYSYQIIVADDHSTDGTVEIVEKYQDKYPEKIVLLKSDKNQKLFKNILRAYENVKTDYFCVLDPDDYWIDNNKIQRALSFLESNPEYTIYVSKSKKVYLDGTEIDNENVLDKYDSDFYDFCSKGTRYLGNTLESVYRNIIFKNGVPEKLKNIEINQPTAAVSFRGDTFRSAIHIKEGKAHKTNDVDSVYRITDSGIYQRLTEYERDLLNCQLFVDLWLYWEEKYIAILALAYGFYQSLKLPANVNKIMSVDEKRIKEIIERYYSLESVFMLNKKELEQYLKGHKNNIGIQKKIKKIFSLFK